MTDPTIPQNLTILERLDLALAGRVAFTEPEERPVLRAVSHAREEFLTPVTSDDTLVSGLLRLRGLAVRPSEVAAVRNGKRCRFDQGHQEYRLIKGLEEVLRLIAAASSQGLTPDGWFLAEMFKVLTRNIPRFRNNTLRKDHPWDGVMYVSYSDPKEIESLLDRFDARRSYLDVKERFDSLHPVRQSLRIFWRFARISPFPDFNMLMAWLAMNSWLLSHSYPFLAPGPHDRERLHSLVRGAPPLRNVSFEARLLRLAEGQHVG